MRQSRSVLACAALTIGLAGVMSCDEQLRNDGEETRKSVKQLSIEQLIEGIASMNPRPIGNNLRYVRSFPKGYESKRQLIVAQCLNELVARGDAAFPALVKHLDDNRYSCLQALDDRDESIRTVSQNCHFLLYSQLRPWPSRIFGKNYRRFGPATPYIVPWNEEAPEWFDARKTKSLLALQREVLEMSLKFVETTDRLVDAPELREEYRAGIEWELRYLNKVSKPVPLCLAWEIRDGEPILRIFASPRITVDDELIKLIGKPPFKVNECGTLIAK